MSFDEQPDGDPHGECAAEIDKLTSENACMKWGLECAQRFVALWERGEISAEGVLPQIKLDIERGLAGFAALSGAREAWLMAACIQISPRCRLTRKRREAWAHTIFVRSGRD